MCSWCQQFKLCHDAWEEKMPNEWKENIAGVHGHDSWDTKYPNDYSLGRMKNNMKSREGTWTGIKWASNLQK